MKSKFNQYLLNSTGDKRLHFSPQEKKNFVDFVAQHEAKMCFTYWTVIVIGCRMFISRVETKSSGTNAG